MNEQLLIFIKNPEKGNVKTRLAADIGEEKALQIYHRLLERTLEVTLPVPYRKTVYYSNHIEEGDDWAKAGFDQALQQGEHLGQRMANAFEEQFHQGKQKVCIIGSDCYQLSPALLQNAFTELEKHDLVIGPSRDGGYYLIGLKAPCPSLFEGIDWSTDRVLSQTREVAWSAGLQIFELEPLQDVDQVEDLITLPPDLLRDIY